MRKMILAAIAVSLMALGAQAQNNSENNPKGDVAVGYSLFHLNGARGSGVTANGISGSADYNVTSWVGIVWDFGVYHGEPHGVGYTAATYTFGPRLWLHLSDNQKFLPFAQVLFGGSHVPGTNPFAFSIGGGTNINIGASRFALRPQLDYFGLHANGGTINSERFSIGIVYNIGER